MAPTTEEEVIGDSLIPLINKLQDIFSQVMMDWLGVMLLLA
jgi:hypothetical protein